MKVKEYARKVTEIPKLAYGLPSRIRREAVEMAQAAYEMVTLAKDGLKELSYNNALRAQRPLIRDLIIANSKKPENKPAEGHIGIYASRGITTPSLRGWSLEAYLSLLTSKERAILQGKAREAENKLAALRFKEYILRISEATDPNFRSTVIIMPDGDVHFTYGGNAGIISETEVYYRGLRLYELGINPRDIGKNEAKFVADAGDLMKAVKGPNEQWETRPPESVFTHSHWHNVMEEVGEKIPHPEKTEVEQTNWATGWTDADRERYR